MKALTLTQPWATAVALGIKRIETRSWGTRYRGPVAIHAAKGMDYDARFFCIATHIPDLVHRRHIENPLFERGYATFRDYPKGAVLATARIEQVCYTDLLLDRWPERLTPTEAAFGDYSRGRWAWILADVRLLIPESPARGALGLWEWEPRYADGRPIEAPAFA